MRTQHQGSHSLLQHVEVFGAIDAQFARHLRRLSRKARGAKARDRTRYTTTHRRPDYLTHHMRHISHAAVIKDAECIDIALRDYKSRAAALTSRDDPSARPPSAQDLSVRA